MTTTEAVPADLLAGLRSGAWLNDQTFAPLAYAVPGIVPEGFTLLVGPPKAGKSWLALQLALAVASGGRALGHIETGKPRPVLLLALEDGDRRLQDRCRELLDGEPIPAELEYLTRITPGRVVDTIGQWLDTNGDRAPLAILDTLGKVTPPALPGESAYGRDYRIGGALKRSVDPHPGASLVALHHDRKAASDDFVDAVSGTNGLAGAADTITVLVRERHSPDGLLKVTGRDVLEAEYAMTMSNGVAWQLDGRSLADSARRAGERRSTRDLGDRSADIVALVGMHSDGVRAAQVAAEVGIADAAAGVYLRRLAESGRIVKASRGLYTPVLSVLFDRKKPYTKNTLNTGIARACVACGFPLAAALVTSGETTHATCGTES